MTSLPLKTPLATLLCFLAGCLALRALPLQKRDRIFLWVPPVTFLAIASFLNQINIGIRHILFIYLFLFLIAGAIVPWMERLSNQLLRKFLQWVCMTVVTVSVFRTVTLAPHYLSYFSEWVGGAKEGAALAAGSNVSWGQDNRRLAKWAKEQNIASIRIRVPAHNPAEYAYYGVPLESVKDEELQNPPPGYYALDLGTYLQQQKDEQSWFAGKEPLYRAGKTIYVFKV